MKDLNTSWWINSEGEINTSFAKQNGFYDALLIANDPSL